MYIYTLIENIAYSKLFLHFAFSLNISCSSLSLEVCEVIPPHFYN